MGTGIQTSDGKAFEYACVIALCEQLEKDQRIVIEHSMQLSTAKRLYDSAKEGLKESLDAAARSAVKVIKRLEPQLCNSIGNEPLWISLQADAAGIGGDVRDILCLRKQNGWEIGLSCKHNHHAVKHSRLSGTIDFGQEWLNIPCSKDYFNKVVPLFSELRELRDRSKMEGKPVLWAELEEKNEKYYIPVLQAFMEELRRIACKSNENVPEKLIRYLLGRYDFYKVITDDKNRTTKIEGINIAGTLNCSSDGLKPIVKIPVLKMPTQFYHIGFKVGSKNTIEVVCDEGWQISMRIHNASSKVEPSLKFDVNLVSFPITIHTQTEPWDNDSNIKRRQRLGEYAEKLLGKG